MIVRYTLDIGRSRFTVQAFATGLLSSLAHNPTFAIREFAGELSFTPETMEDAAFELTARADSLTLIDAISPKDRAEIEDRMRAEVLETKAYPEIEFRTMYIPVTRVAENWYRVQLRGELGLHGVYNAYLLDAQLRLLEKEMRLSGECKLLLSTYKMTRVSALGGLVQLTDDLLFSFDLVGSKVSQ